MNIRIRIAGIAFSTVATAATGAAFAEAAAHTAALTPDHHISCSEEAKGLKGDEHHKSVVECLKERSALPGSQQNRMKHCNEEAGKQSLHGADRRTFMSGCLKGQHGG